MRSYSSAALAVLLLFGCGKPQEAEKQAAAAVAAPGQRASALKREMDLAYGSVSSLNPLTPKKLPKISAGECFDEPLSIPDRLLGLINPEALRKYEGSFTFAEFKAQRQDQVPEYSLSSTWLLTNSALPRASIKTAQNPDTGELEVSGGEIFLPESGLGVSFEKDEASGETRTFLHLKHGF
ncbi:hypothetical protein [Pontiella sp.]|uniref:hypothetical protein n=1 Tax=Pontiella sp. TaxID=2837462 RepID=UPI0035662CF6